MTGPVNKSELRMVEPRGREVADRYRFSARAARIRRQVVCAGARER